MRRYSVLLLTMATLLAGCSMFKGKSKSGDSGDMGSLAVRGYVLFPGPDSLGVAGVAVETFPPSMRAISNADGSFAIERGLLPGDYTFAASYQGERGETRHLVQFGDTRDLFITLGRVASVPALDSTGVRALPVQAGGTKKRTDS